MTKKQFAAIAAAISKVSDPKERRDLANEIGRVCQEKNADFSWAKWDKACGF